MTNERLPSGQRPRRDQSPNLASSHAENIAVASCTHPRSHAQSSLSEIATEVSWLLRVTMIGIAIITGFMMLSVVKGRAEPAREMLGPPQIHASVCESWIEAASNTIAQLAQRKPTVDVRQISDAVTRMRRARRLCDLGLVKFACLELDAIIQGVTSPLHTGPAPMCWPVMLDPAADLIARR